MKQMFNISHQKNNSKNTKGKNKWALIQRKFFLTYNTVKVLLNQFDNKTEFSSLGVKYHTQNIIYEEQN